MENLYPLEISVLVVLHPNKMRQHERLLKLHWPQVYLLKKQWQKLQQLQEFHHHLVVSEQTLCQQQLEVMNSQEALLVLAVRETLVLAVQETLVRVVLEILVLAVLGILVLAVLGILVLAGLGILVRVVLEILVRVVLEILVLAVLEILVLAVQELVTHFHS